jgi:cell division protein FtsB
MSAEPAEIGAVPSKRSRRPPRAALARRWLGLAAVVLVAYLYYHPLRTYFATRGELAARRAEVARLAAQRQELERRLEASISVDALAREARALGYVRPGEHLFIVKGIQAWRRARTTIAPDGR